MELSTSAELVGLIYADRTEELIAKCDALTCDGSINSLCAMLLALRDDYDYYDEMTVLLHAVERGPATNVYAAIRESICTVNSNAPNWCETIVKRNLRAERNAFPFSADGFAKALQIDDSAWNLVQKTALQLHSANQIPDDAIKLFK